MGLILFPVVMTKLDSKMRSLDVPVWEVPDVDGCPVGWWNLDGVLLPLGWLGISAGPVTMGWSLAKLFEGDHS